MNKKGDKTDRSSYTGISLLLSTYKIFSNILLSMLTPHAEEITGNHQCGFQCNRSTSNHIFCTHQKLEKKWEYNDAVHYLFVDLKTAYDSVRKNVFNNTLMEFGIPMKLVRLIKSYTCLTCFLSR